MYVKLNKNKQKEIMRNAVKKAGSYKKLSKILNIPKSSLFSYFNGRVILEERFQTIINFLEIDKEKLLIKKLDQNWKQVLGGKLCVHAKKKKGTFEKQLKNAQEKGAMKLKEWHKHMKKNHPKKYYLIQYSNLKKVAGYKYKTKRGEKVRNIFEKQVADIFYDLGIAYEYEPLINSGEKYFFPDFLINKNIIVECTTWRGKSKAYQLKEKIRHLEKKYRVFVVIPKSLYTYYKILNPYLVLGLEKFVPVAQTFLIRKK